MRWSEAKLQQVDFWTNAAADPGRSPDSQQLNKADNSPLRIEGFDGCFGKRPAAVLSAVGVRALAESLLAPGRRVEDICPAWPPLLSAWGEATRSSTTVTGPSLMPNSSFEPEGVAAGELRTMYRAAPGDVGDLGAPLPPLPDEMELRASRILRFSRSINSSADRNWNVGGCMLICAASAVSAKKKNRSQVRSPKLHFREKKPLHQNLQELSLLRPLTHRSESWAAG